MYRIALYILWICLVVGIAHYLTGCGAATTFSADTTTILPSVEGFDPLEYGALCEEISAHVTRAQFGNRPIVVDGVTIHCF
jgi:hypothetical protein